MVEDEASGSGIFGTLRWGTVPLVVILEDVFFFVVRFGGLFLLFSLWKLLCFELFSFNKNLCFVKVARFKGQQKGIWFSQAFLSGFLVFEKIDRSRAGVSPKHRNSGTTKQNMS